MNKEFSTKEQDTLRDIMRHRRDVRGNKFVDQPISDEAVQQILQVAELSPSVGFSQEGIGTMKVHMAEKFNNSDLIGFILRMKCNTVMMGVPVNPSSDQ